MLNTTADELTARERTSNSDWLSSLAWDADADQRLASEAAAGNVRRFAGRLAELQPPVSGRWRKFGVSACSHAARLLAVDGATAMEHVTRETLRAAQGGMKRKLAKNHVAAILDAAENSVDVPAPVVAAWLTLLPTLATRLDRQSLFSFWRKTLEATYQFLDSHRTGESDPVDVTAELRDEILFRAGIVFSPLASAREWMKTGRKNWRTRWDQAETDHTVPRLCGSPLQDWLASLARVSLEAKRFEATLWKKSHCKRLQRLATDLAAALKTDGSLCGLGGRPDEMPLLLETLGELAGWDPQSPPARLVQSIVRGKPRQATNQLTAAKKRNRPAWQSDDAGFALLRSNWGADAGLCSVWAPGREMSIDCQLGGDALFAGPWDVSVRFNGTPVAIAGDWTCECWFSDRDADFVELAADLGEGASLLRQVILAREESLLIIAEAVRGVAADTSVGLQSSLRLASRVASQEDGSSRELRLQFGKRLVRSFPIHLPWERAARAEGRVSVSDAAIVGETNGDGNRCQVYVFDWSDRRGDRPADGGPLSVAESGEHLPPSDACAGRVRVGSRQWFYWHNLTRGRIPRTVLGHHSENETVVGRFDDDGEVHLLVHVEPDDRGEE